jgi:hypothetical protein
LTSAVSLVVTLIDYDRLAGSQTISSHQKQKRVSPCSLFGWLLLKPYNQKSDNQKAERQVAILGIVALVVLGLVALMAISKMLN